MAILGSIAQWILKIFLGGLFNKVMTQIEDEAKQKMGAAQASAQSTDQAAQVDIAVVKKQVEAKASVEAAKPTEADPFADVDWNARP